MSNIKVLCTLRQTFASIGMLRQCNVLIDLQRYSAYSGNQTTNGMVPLNFKLGN